MSHETNEKAEDVLSRVIAEQGVTPITDLDELAARWPADDDPDALMNFVSVRTTSPSQTQP